MCVCICVQFLCHFQQYFSHIMVFSGCAILVKYIYHASGIYHITHLTPPSYIILAPDQTVLALPITNLEYQLKSSKFLKILICHYQYLTPQQPIKNQNTQRTVQAFHFPFKNTILEEFWKWFWKLRGNWIPSQFPKILYDFPKIFIKSEIILCNLRWMWKWKVLCQQEASNFIWWNEEKLTCIK